MLLGDYLLLFYYFYFQHFHLQSTWKPCKPCISRHTSCKRESPTWDSQEWNQRFQHLSVLCVCVSMCVCICLSVWGQESDKAHDSLTIGVIPCFSLTHSCSSQMHQHKESIGQFFYFFLTLIIVIFVAL